jgi:hypothetical protein
VGRLRSKSSTLIGRCGYGRKMAESETDDAESTNEPDRPVKVMTGQLNRAAEELKRELAIDEMGFRHVAVQAHQSARDYVVFEALDEIQKMVLSIFQGLDLVSGDELDPKDPFTRIGAEYLSDETALWQRKMIELLADLIGFSATPDDHYYRDFLLLVQLDGVTSAQRDQREFYGSESANYQVQIDDLCLGIAELESADLDPTVAWYRKDRRPLDPGTVRPGQILSSFASRLRHAMPLATANERGALGYSYGAGFGRTSRGIHVRPGVSDPVPDTDDLKAGPLVTVVMGVNLLVRCQETIGSTPTGVNESLRRALEGSDAAIGKTRLSGRADVGDLVVVSDKVGQVIEVQQGEYGYESYLVRYLTKPFLPNVPEDWHTAQHVARLRTARRIREDIQADIDSGRIAAEKAAVLLDLDDERLIEYYGQGMAKLWDAGVGLKEHILDQVELKRRKPRQ